MTAEHRERLRLRHRPEDLFELVGDVRRYPDFIGPITAMRVYNERQDEAVERLRAEARIRFRVVRERFVTDVALDPANRRIDVDFVDGPFDVLGNRWRFHALSDGSTLVDFYIRYKFSNRILQMLLDSNRQRAVRYLVNAFAQEADRRYETVGEPDLDLSAEAPAQASRA